MVQEMDSAVNAAEDSAVNDRTVLTAVDAVLVTGEITRKNGNDERGFFKIH